MKVPPAFLKDTVSVRTYNGETGLGSNFGDPTNVKCSVRSEKRVVTDASGREVVTLAEITAEPDKQTLLTPESEVTLSGRKTKVVQAEVERAGLGPPSQLKVLVA